MTTTLKFPVGIETFSEIIRGDYAYVDKSKMIYRLTQSGKFFFLSRPRRFGKSLLISTLESYFEGRKELFEGLWLGQAEGVDWTPHPVLRLNFVNTKSTVDGLYSTLEYHLRKWEEKYEIQNLRLSYGERLKNVIEQAFNKTGQRVAVLIDEYDKVLVNTLHEPEVHEEMKRILKPVFGVLKGADQYIQFGILTGVSRFSRLSIFSDINNLEDISLSPDYAAICGFTADEIRQYFKQGVEMFAETCNTDFEGMMQILKDNYDGYHFAGTSPDIYNPYSLILALKNRRLSHQWFESGTPTFLLEKIRNTDEDVRAVFTQEVSANTLSNTSITDTSLLSILYQTGYLTIKSYDPEEDSFVLGIPNREVEFGLYSGLLPFYTGKDEVANDSLLIKLRRALRANEMDRFMEALKSYLAAIPYSLTCGKSELYYENNLFLIFRMLGFNAQVETQTSQGRIDVTMTTPKYIYIIELKLDSTPEVALKQIEDKNYGLPFEIDDRTIVRIGVSFSSETRTIDRWIIQS